MKIIADESKFISEKTWGDISKVLKDDMNLRRFKDLSDLAVFRTIKVNTQRNHEVI